MDLTRDYTIIPRNQRKTRDIMSKNEYTRVLAETAQSIANGRPSYVNYGNENDPIKIAEMEIRSKKSNLRIMRGINKSYEIWDVNELDIPKF